jgi:hypothetical protein
MVVDVVKVLDAAYVIVGILMRALWYAELAVFGMLLSFTVQVAFSY